MYDCHRDSYIDSLINATVKIATYDGHEVEGKLKGYEHGRYIVDNGDHDYAFRKSHITSIKKL